VNYEQELEMKLLVTFVAPVVTATPAFAHIVPFLIFDQFGRVATAHPYFTSVQMHRHR
jgi:hypothetical protein